MNKTENSKIKIKAEIESQRALLQTYLASDMDIDEMDYNEVINYAISDVNNQNIFLGHWKDYAFLRGKLEGYSQARHDLLIEVDKIINDEEDNDSEDIIIFRKRIKNKLNKLNRA